MKTKEQIIEIIESDKLIQKYMYKYIWISGSSTQVAPITVWSDGIYIQIHTRKNVFAKCIGRIVKASDGLLSKGSFVKRDGSCPDILVFYFS